MKKLSLLLIILTVLVSCKNTDEKPKNIQQEAVTESINEDEIKVFANQFLELLHGKIDFKKMKEMYVDMPRFNIWGIDGYTVEGVEQIDDELIVTSIVESRDSDIEGNSIVLLKLKKIDGELKIIDSKGLASFFDYEIARAIENNTIQENDDLWDVEKIIAIKKAKK